MRYRTLLLFVLMFASAVGAALTPAVYDNLFPVLLFIAFPGLSALMFTSIVYDIAHPRPAVHIPKPRAAKRAERALPLAVQTRARHA